MASNVQKQDNLCNHVYLTFLCRIHPSYPPSPSGNISIPSSRNWYYLFIIFYVIAGLMFRKNCLYCNLSITMVLPCCSDVRHKWSAGSDKWIWYRWLYFPFLSMNVTFFFLDEEKISTYISEDEKTLKIGELGCYAIPSHFMLFHILEIQENFFTFQL